MSASRPLTAQPALASRADGRRAPDLRLVPIEPLERIELSAPPSVQGRLYGDRDDSVGQGDETAARLRALGIERPLFKRFPCVLPGHEHPARVHFTSAGFWQYSCEALARSAGLGEVRAFIAYGQQRSISRVEAARWRERLDFEAHLRYPTPLRVEVPDPCPQAAGIVVAKMQLFVGLRDRRFPPHEPFPFARDFAMAYTGLTSDRVRGAIDWLERAQVIKRAGMSVRAITWRLAAQPPPPPEPPGGVPG